MTSIIKVNTIADIGNNTLLETNGSGTITTNNIGGQNTPAFSAYLSADQSSVSAGSYTKVNLNAEDFDTDSAFDSSSNYRFTVPSGKGGKYLITGAVEFNDFNGGSYSTKDLYSAVLYKNGSLAKMNTIHIAAAVNGTGVSLCAILDLSASDYIELYALADVGAGTGKINGGDQTTWLMGNKLIGA